MTIDKSWIFMSDRRSDEYFKGVDAFMDIAKNYENEEGLIRCPCSTCVNGLWHKPSRVRAHIIDKGFNPVYIKWRYHGETNIYTNPMVQESGGDGYDEMLDVLEDLVEPTHETTLEDHQSEDDEGENSRRGAYDDLFAEVEIELYPGCHKISALNCLAKLMHLKNFNKWTNNSFDMLLKLLKEILPDGSKLPSSHYAAKRLMSKLGLGYEKIHVCPNDCSLYWKETSASEQCYVCGESRWVDPKTKGKKVAKKVLRYFPLTPRLQRLYKSRHTAKDMQWHSMDRKTDGLLRHPRDGKAWKEFDKTYLDFSMEPRNVRLGLAADGFNPFGNMNTSYSMWPVVLTTYNVPPWLCMKESFFMLTLLIPGPRSPGKDMDVFLRPLIDELNVLWKHGVETRDIMDNTIFKMRAALLWTVNDFPARSSLSGWSGQGYKACPTCNIDTSSIRVEGKISYIGHRRFLPSSHPLRNNKNIDGATERRKQPRPLLFPEIMEQLDRLPERHPGKHPNFRGKEIDGENSSVRKRKRQDCSGKRSMKDIKEHNWTKKSIFWELPYWRSLLLRHNLDVMHVEKNVCESLIGTIMNIEGKTKDTVKARIDLKNLNVRSELHMFRQGDKWVKPAAKFTMSIEERKKFCEFIKSVRFPDNFASNLKKNVTDNDTKIIGLKSHDCHIFIQCLLPVGIRKFLPKNISSSIIELCNFFQQICSRTLNIEDLRKSEEHIVLVLSKLELIFPPAFFDIMVHLVMHLPEEAILGGPV